LELNKFDYLYIILFNPLIPPPPGREGEISGRGRVCAFRVSETSTTPYLKLI